ncbi:MAG: cache domain-containing protein, partial [bacterium]
MKLSDLKMDKKLTVMFVVVGLTPLLVTATISYVQSTGALTEAKDEASGALHDQTFGQLVSLRDVKKERIEGWFEERRGDMGVLVETVDTLREEAFNKLEAIRGIKKNQIERFFAERTANARTLAKSPFVLEAYQQCRTAFEESGGAGSGTFQGHTNGRYDAPNSYVEVHDQYFDTFKHLMNEYELYDIFLMTPDDGDAVFTVTKEDDFAQRASKIDSSLRDVWETAVSERKVAVSDTQPYAPSGDAPAQFIAAPIEKDGEIVGVVAVRISIDAVNEIMAERAGMGKTGETYLVGPDLLMRSDSCLSPDSHRVTASFANPSKGKVDTKASQAAVDGETGTQMVRDYNDNPVLSAYVPIQVGDVTWGLLAEMNMAEAFSPRIEGAQDDYFTQYTEKHGYYDLFLINPDGYCFYTVGQEADYQSNLIDGKYRDSNFGKLVREVIETQKFGFADFQPYAPSNGAQAAFIAQPILSRDGKVQAIVGLQLRTDEINTMMTSRTGLGETGCTYLVGRNPDGQIAFRSDLTFMDEDYVIGTPISTEYIEESMESPDAEDCKVFTDSHGEGTIAAYSGLNVLGSHWAMIAKIDEAEAFAAADQIQASAEAATSTLLWSALLVAGIAGVSVGVLGWWFARTMTKPIDQIVDEGKRLTDAVVDGKLQTRGDPELVNLEFRPIIEGVNTLIDTFVSPFNVMAEYVDRISKGDIPDEITDEYKGDFNEIKNNLNRCIDAMNTLEQESMTLVESMKNGKLDARSNPGELAGSWAQLLSGFNQTLDAVIEPLNVAAEYVDRISKGDMPEKITDDYNGDFNEIKNNLNQCIEALNELVTEMRHMSQEHNAGDIDVVISTDKFHGTYREMAEGIN